jgi:hypothetical protein
MKKIDLLHTTVLIVAILCGYSALQTLLGILNFTVYYTESLYDRSGAAILPTFLQAAAYAIACIILVRNSKRIATSLLGNDRPEYEEFLEGDETGSTHEASPAPAPSTDENPDDLQWHLDRKTVLFSLFIGLGLYTLIQYIPLVLNQLISQFKDKVGEGALNLARPAQRDYLVLYLIRLTAGAVLIYAAPALTNYIEKTLSTRLQSESKTT